MLVMMKRVELLVDFFSEFCVEVGVDVVGGVLGLVFLLFVGGGFFGVLFGNVVLNLLVMSVVIVFLFDGVI